MEQEKIVKSLVEKETKRFVWDMQDFTKDQFEFIKERMMSVAGEAINEWINSPVEEEKEEEDVCSTCGGSGEVSTMEAVYPGEPHMAPVGTSPCPDCRPGPDNDENQDE